MHTLGLQGFDLLNQIGSGGSFDFFQSELHIGGLPVVFDFFECHFCSC